MPEGADGVAQPGARNPMNHLEDPQEKPAASKRDEADTLPDTALSGLPTRRAYEAPKIISSKIFHRVMLNTPQPGFPGCDAY